MEITEIKAIHQEVIKDIICDCCGKSCNIFTEKILKGVIDNIKKTNPDKREVERLKKSKPKQFEYLKLETTWGFGSENDGERWSAQICGKCVDEKFAFVKFKKENYNILGD